MAVPQGVWGIDVGQCALKALRLELVDGQVTATAFDYIEHPKILSQPDADPDQLTREALDKFLSRNNLRGDTIVISVPGQSGLARFVKLPPVEEKKISDIVRFEAKQQIPFPLDEVALEVVAGEELLQRLAGELVGVGVGLGEDLGVLDEVEGGGRDDVVDQFQPEGFDGTLAYVNPPDAVLHCHE